MVEMDVVTKDLGHALFCEFFAGNGVLTNGVKKEGVPTAVPEDLVMGGLDFLDYDTVGLVKERLANRAADGTKLMVHFAPPCSTFSRARDRSWKTRLRSTARPQGLLGRGAQTREANLIATRTKELIEYCVADLKCAVSLENPQSSYLWAFLDFGSIPEYQDAVFSPCMLGGQFRKPTRVRCWGWFPSSLDAPCKLSGDAFSCGRLRANPHPVLEFGSFSTKHAAEYEAPVVEQWSAEVRRYFEQTPSDEQAAKEASIHVDGRVHRHVFRGGETKTAKEKKDDEDKECKAGMRNPAWMEHTWPELWATMAPIARLLVEARTHCAELQDLAGCCGAEPCRQPPSEAVLSILRSALEELSGADKGSFEVHHEATTWRGAMVSHMGALAKDPDRHIGKWLLRGAPMGLDCVIEPGGLFPEKQEAPERSVDELDKLEVQTSNHQSFEELHGEDKPPAWSLLQEQVDQGFAYCFADAEEAERALGGKVHPSPLGNVTTEKDDGSLKHRLIQDQRMNNVNAAAVLPERQVLPRGVDHGADLAFLNEDKKDTEELNTLILDFKDAFMSIPVAPREKRFNCARTGFELTRARDELFEGEARTATFVVWRVLGFGGRANPLVFARVASFACRSAQALLGPWRREDRTGCWTQVARGLLQLFVDDPAMAVCGTKAQNIMAVDLVILWWLLLGVPLSWKKGAVFDQEAPHKWIGIVYSVVKDGALMRLPEKFVQELLALLKPLTKANGVVQLSSLDAVVGKCARVAHVVPSARPFVGALWGALGAAQKAARDERREAPPGCAPVKRFNHAAAWIQALLEEREDCPLPLERLVRPGRVRAPITSGWWVEFDASPYGGGSSSEEHQRRDRGVLRGLVAG